jgi:hypothetical protein
MTGMAGSPSARGRGVGEIRAFMFVTGLLTRAVADCFNKKVQQKRAPVEYAESGSG